MLKESFSTADLVRYGGLQSKHMVAYLCRTGILAPSLSKARGRGIARQFSYADLLLARSVSTLLKSGVSIEGLKSVLKTLRNKLAKTPATELSKKHVVILGRRVYLRDTPESVVELTAEGQLAFHFVLEAPELGAGKPARVSNNKATDRIKTSRGERRA